jgi:hypothetical protein
MAMAETFTALFTAHLLGCFIAQTAWMAERKRRLWAPVLGAAIVTSASYALLGNFLWQILLVVFLMHLALDAVEAYRPLRSLTALAAIQLAHLAVLLTLAFRFPGAAQDGCWMTNLAPGLPGWYFASLTFISGLILCVPVGGNLIARLTARFANEIRDNDITGLKRGGQYIGWLERSLVMLLLLINQPNGIGFLIAAKSVLRFGEIRDQGQRKVAEYIIIGTFLSFGWALLISVLTQRALRYWLP